MGNRAMRVVGGAVYFLPVRMRVPLKFGNQVLKEVTCLRVRLDVESEGKRYSGWGETPLSVGWVWPSELGYGEREEALKACGLAFAEEMKGAGEVGHPFLWSARFLDSRVERVAEVVSEERGLLEEGIPHLAALVCYSAFDLALYDAYGRVCGVGALDVLGAGDLEEDLSAFLLPAGDGDVSFEGKYPADFLCESRTEVPVWHLVGGLDALEDSELDGSEPEDGYPVTLREWIRRDGLTCLKVKLRGDDVEWDWERLVRVGEIAVEEGVDWLTTDFNCMVTDPLYVNGILDRLRDEHPRIYGMVLYVEQPFPYDLQAHPIDVHSVSARKPLFMDESAHDWRYVKQGRELGWTGVALKTCKTMTGALLSLCWARAHGMELMVQDLTNPMMAQIPHVTLAARAGTIMGVESNGMQFYPEASCADRVVHPGLYQRRGGVLDLGSLGGEGFGYREEEVGYDLPQPVFLW